MKLKTLVLLERGMSMGYGSMTSGDTQLRAMPGKENHLDDVDYWNGVTEGKGWFCYRESNNWDSKRSGASITITEGEPHRFWVKIKTHGLKKPGDTNESFRQRVRKHTDKVSKAWITAARNLHNNQEINEVGNYIQKTWNECFKEALQDPKVAPHLESSGEQKMAASADPVNFTYRLEESRVPEGIRYFVQVQEKAGIDGDAVADFTNTQEANKFCDDCQRSNQPYKCFIQFPTDEQFYDSRDHTGNKYITWEKRDNNWFDKFREIPNV